jgi:tetratricopeptide (TPR) repeat protein
MIKFLKIFIWFIFIINFSNISFSKENFYIEGVKLFKSNKYEEAKFLFERSIVANPKHSESYLYLAKIYKEKKNKKEEEKNLETTLLINPANEEAIFMLMEIALEKTNYSRVKELSDRFTKVCKTLCKQNDLILKDLENLEPKNES